MLARTSGFGPPCSRTRRTSQGMSRPVESRWIHSNTCDSPATASFSMLAMRRHRRLPIGLNFGADRVQVDGQQLFARHLEQPQRRLVRLDEALRVRVDDGDGFRRVVDQRAITRLAVAQRLLRDVSFGDVAQADDEHFAAAVARAADGNLRREQRAVAAARGDLGAQRACRGRCRSIPASLVEPGGDRTRPRAMPGTSASMRRPNNSAGWIGEHAFGHRVGAIDDACGIGRDHHVLDVIEDDLQLGGALLGDLDAERARFVRHELHGAHHRAALVVDDVVVTAEHFEQFVRADAPARHARAQFPQLRLQQRMQAPHREIAHVQATAGCRNGARSGRGGIRALVGGGALGRF